MPSDEIRIRRGLILMALEANHPLRTRRRSLEQQVRSFYDGTSQAALEADLRYLEEAGYIGRHMMAVEQRSTPVLWITPAGLMLMEGAAEDAGVQVARP